MIEALIGLFVGFPLGVFWAANHQIRAGIFADRMIILARKAVDAVHPTPRPRRQKLARARREGRI